jgi:chemotaxis protein methyltransferase CheR
VEADQRRWRLFLEGLRLLVIRLDREGRINYLNPFATEVWGYREEEILGRHFLEFQLPSEKERLQRLFSRAIDGELSLRVTEVLATRTGGKRLITWSTAVVRNAAGIVTSMLCIGADITEQAEAEAARDRTMKELADLKARLEEENLYLKEEIGTNQDFSNIIGQGDAVRYVLQKIHQVAKTSAIVLIEGETGVGKELVARAVHEASSRADGPFIRLNCATLPPTLVESELFGHEKGAFTGADRQRKGRFELAEGGTLFLDEVGELPLEIQGKLLRVLQESEFERVGDSKTRKSDVRIIAATNRNLEQEVAVGRFRKDLFYRLHVYPITVPPLRDRREDIPLLVQHFVRRLALRHGKTINEVPGQVMRLFSEWDWPGNVRELENVVERSVITTSGTVLKLPTEFGRPSPPSPTRSLPVSRSMVDVERQHVLQVLETANWQVAGPGGAAEVLGLHPNTLRSRMQKLGLTKKSLTSQHKVTSSH